MITCNSQRAEPVSTVTRVVVARAGAGRWVRISWVLAVVSSLLIGHVAARPVVAQLALGLLGVSLASAALVDVHEQRLPNSLLAIGAVAGVVAAVADRVLGGAFVGLAVAGGLMLLVRLTRGVGMGDVKMAGVVGLATAEAGLVAAPIAVAIAALTAGVVGAVAGRTRLPLGPSLWLGWALALVLPIGRWWS
ncbi:MAG: hypothetical protein F2681_10605 [Actinobacteria bacterium]|uniref:Unannotated protein n=1 Tax=freshwater metagenome TaxID=449393 RepID=A0A6J7JJS1_9ZZZZ|nr:hypothetical protein [Actinomycetota bacterium]MSW78333.1 hypothetical protein [Actinomycetota bacterium]MSX56355.1 hypothetical protein [Actinomycetota bacterium]MSX94283.1 hypothetical protein [Actinomycetota bacterium]MSZ83579.1 hypothetical protein [Actinomycetota bacterium]